MDYRMIVLDLDGTLTNRDKIITPRTKSALMRAQEKGYIVVLASGRPTAGVEPLARELELKRFGRLYPVLQRGNDHKLWNWRDRVLFPDPQGGK